ncbi:MAG: zf-HC2 domain-containing protein [Chloroflexota bacterium]|nr:zf-HC2 domain-containing protein [Chloroflexota bacterium]
MNEQDDMTCQEFVEMITDYLEGALSATERARFEDHLADCDGCELYMKHMRTTIRLTGKLSVAAVPIEGKDKLLNVYRTWKNGAK